MGDSNVSRRNLLGAVAISAVAGCTAVGSESGVQLGNVQIGNTVDKPISFKLRIERDGALIYLNRIEVDAGALHDIERTWNSEPGDYSVFYTTSLEDAIHRLSTPVDDGSGNANCVDLRFHCRSDTTDSVTYDESKPGWSGC